MFYSLVAKLLENIFQGILIAIDKTPRKVVILREKCDIFGATNVQIFQANSTKIVLQGDGNLHTRHLPNCPPFPEESFDRVLLDAPCSALGKRPQLANRMSASEIKSFVPLQRKLMEAVSIRINFGSQISCQGVNIRRNIIFFFNCEFSHQNWNPVGATNEVFNND